MDEPLEKSGVTTNRLKNKRWERGMNAVASAGMEYSET